MGFGFWGLIGTRQYALLVLGGLVIGEALEEKWRN